MIRILALVAAMAFANAHAATAQVMAIGAAEQGSLLYAAGVAVAKVLNEKFKIQARVQPFAGSSTYAPMLSRGELDFGLINVDDAMTAYRGIDNFAGRPIRICASWR